MAKSEFFTKGFCWKMEGRGSILTHKGDARKLKVERPAGS
jgi:hypothetical protein